MSKIFMRLTAISTALVMASACATTPPATQTLYSGLSQAETNKVFPDADGNIGRSAADPVCVKFYANAQAYKSQIKPSGGGSQFLTSVGLATLAGFAGEAIGGAGISSTAGQIAVNTATNQAVYQGGALVLDGLKPSSQAARNITDASNKLGCPVVLT